MSEERMRKRPANTCECDPPGDLDKKRKGDKPSGCSGYVCAACRRTRMTCVEMEASDRTVTTGTGQRWRMIDAGGRTVSEERIVEVRPAHLDTLRRTGEVRLTGFLIRLPEALDAADVSALLGLQVRTLRAIVRRGELAAYHAGPRLVFTRRAVLAWARNRADG